MLACNPSTHLGGKTLVFKASLGHTIKTYIKNNGKKIPILQKKKKK